MFGVSPSPVLPTVMVADDPSMLPITPSSATVSDVTEEATMGSAYAYGSAPRVTAPAVRAARMRGASVRDGGRLLR